MLTCPRCQRLFRIAQGFCPIDGVRLEDLESVALPQDAQDPLVGLTLQSGRFQIWRVVAEGAMGRIYQAVDRHEADAGSGGTHGGSGSNPGATDSWGVAIKVLNRTAVKDPVQVERFRREYALGQELKSPYVIRVDALVEEPELAERIPELGAGALLLEYLEGEDLRHRIDRLAGDGVAMDREMLLRILSQVSLGLEAAHQRGLVHRDLKPENVFVCGTPQGDSVRLLDFGSVRDNSAGAKKLTMLGTTIGSPFYMAPEQARGSLALDARADVWALAVIAYELFSGRVPFAGSNGPSILLSILSKRHEPLSGTLGARDTVHTSVEDSPAERYWKAYPIGFTVDAVFDHALEKDPEARIATPREFVERLGSALGATGDLESWATRPIHWQTPAISAPAAAPTAAPAALAAAPAVVATQPADGVEVAEFGLAPEGVPESTEEGLEIPKDRTSGQGFLIAGLILLFLAGLLLFGRI